MFEKVHIVNFMSLEDVTVTFDDSGIVKLVGYNDSGKSAVLRALNTLLTYSDKDKHKRWIKNGAQFFEITAYFTDGVKVSLRKFKSGQAEYTMYRGEDLLYTNKLNSGLYDKIIGVPEEIASYFNLPTLPGGQSLNIGFNTDPQLLVETTGSQNYEVLNTYLSSLSLMNAVAHIKKHNNALNNEISNKYSRINVYTHDLNESEGLDEELVDLARAASDYWERIQEQLDTITSATEAITAYTEAKKAEIGDIPPVPSNPVQDELIRAVSELAFLKEMDLSPVDKGPLPDIEAALFGLTSLKPLVGQRIPHVEPVTYDGGLQQAVGLALDACKDYAGIVQEVKATDHQLSHLTSERDSYVQQERGKGHVVTQCSQCGKVSVYTHEGVEVG